MPGSCVCATPDEVRAEDARRTQRADAHAIACLVDERMTPLRYAGAEGGGMPMGERTRAYCGARSAQAATKWTWLSLLAPQQTSPARLQLTIHKSRRHYGGPLARTPRAGDGRHVPAGLLARGSRHAWVPRHVARRLRLPAVAGSGFWGGARRLQLRGQPRLLRPTLSCGEPRTAFPFHRHGPSSQRGRDETVTLRQARGTGARLSTGRRAVRANFSRMMTAAPLRRSPGCHKVGCGDGSPRQRQVRGCRVRGMPMVLLTHLDAVILAPAAA